MRFPWWRAKGIEGEIRSTGRRLNGNRMVLAAGAPPGYRPDGRQASALVFPSDGCREVIARVGAARQPFVGEARGLPEGDRGRTFGRQPGAACLQPPPRSGPIRGIVGMRAIIRGAGGAPARGCRDALAGGWATRGKCSRLHRVRSCRKEVGR